MKMVELVLLENACHRYNIESFVNIGVRLIVIHLVLKLIQRLAISINRDMMKINNENRNDM